MNRPLYWRTAIVLGIFSILGSSMVAVTEHLTREQILANERQSMLDKLRAILPTTPIDNDLLADQVEVSQPDLLGSSKTTLYRARHQGQPVAVVLTSVVENGYSGPIQLLIGVRADGQLSGVRVVSHKETPGLGDKIEEQKSNWIYSFTGKSLSDPAPEQWLVKRDGGVFDQFTGATITPRSVVKTVKNTLIYVQQQGRRLYDLAPHQASEARS